MTINCKGELIDLEIPKVMGVLNITPNSFYDGGKYHSESEILDQVEKMLLDGAAFIDVGAYSSKPGADFVSTETELERVIPIVKSIIQNFPEAILSIDTFRHEVAKSAIENGAAMINDIAAGTLDEKMFETVAALKVPYIMMHMRGNPQTMQKLTDYTDIIKEMLFYFSEKIQLARSFGIDDIIVDPGFGFAKTIAQNYHLLHNLELFKILDLPFLVGISRKSMIYKTLGSSVEEALNGTTVLNTIALSKDAKIIRVHDVKEAVECVKLYESVRQSNVGG